MDETQHRDCQPKLTLSRRALLVLFGKLTFDAASSQTVDEPHPSIYTLSTIRRVSSLCTNIFSFCQQSCIKLYILLITVDFNAE